MMVGWMEMLFADALEDVYELFAGRVLTRMAREPLGVSYIIECRLVALPRTRRQPRAWRSGEYCRSPWFDPRIRPVWIRRHRSPTWRNRSPVKSIRPR